MPIVRRVIAVADEIGEYLLALCRHWGPIVSGAVIGLLTWIYGVRKGASFPTNYYVDLLVIAAFVAAFLAWREEREKPAIPAIRPRLRAEITVVPASVMTSTGAGTPILIHNDGDAVAYNVFAEQEIRRGCVLRIGPVASVDNDATGAPLDLIVDGKRWENAHYNDLYRFLLFAEWRAGIDTWSDVQNSLSGKTDAEAKSIIDGALAKAGFSPTTGDVADIDVAYTDFDRRISYRTPHILRFSGRTGWFEFSLKNVPEPAPTAVVIADSSSRRKSD